MIFGMKHFKMEEASGGEFLGGAGGEGGNNPPADGGQGGGEVSYQYPQGLDESYHGNPTLLKYANEDGSFDQAKIMKSLIHASTTIGADKMPVPTKNFTDEQWKETFQKLGLPESVDKYEVNVQAPEGLEINEDLINGVKAKAHELGVLPHQLEGIINHYNQVTAESIKASEESYTQQIEQNIKGLKEEWGEQFEGKLQLCEQTLNHLYPDEQERAAIKKTGFLDTVEGTKLFARLGEKLREGNVDIGEVKMGASKEEIDSKITETYSQLSSMGKMHPQYQAKLKEYQNLLARKHGNQPVGMGSSPLR